MSAATTNRELFEGETDDLFLLAVQAYVWGFALILAARMRETFTGTR